MSDITTFFPAAGGGGGVLQVEEFTTSGTFDLAAAGISIGDSIIIELVGGGGGGMVYTYNYQIYYPRTYGGQGGRYVSKNFELTSLTNLTITIGAGGAKGTNAAGTTGGDTSVYQGATEISTGNGGLGGNFFGNTVNQEARELIAAKGPHSGGQLQFFYNGSGYAYQNNTATSAGAGVNGLGMGGAAIGYSGGSAGGGLGGPNSNPGCGGCIFDNQADATWAAANGDGTNGIVKIYHS